MRNKQRKALLLLVCLAAALLLTACYTDNDPWPSNTGLTSTATEAPQNAAPEGADPLPAEATEVPEPTQTPGGDDGPGLNG